MNITIFLIAGFTYLANASLRQSRLGYRKRVRGSKRVEFGRFIDAKVEENSLYVYSVHYMLIDECSHQ
jgi:hypothetical protein